jgi:nitroreductase
MIRIVEKSDADGLKSVRSLDGQPLTDAQLADLVEVLCVRRTGMQYGSAGALYPVHAFAIRPRVSAAELWYVQSHSRQVVLTGEVPSTSLSKVILEPWAWPSGCLIAFAIDFRRVCDKYGLRGLRFAALEAGAMTQLIREQAAAQSLSTCIVGGYSDAGMLDMLSLSSDWFGISNLIAVGRPATSI